MPDNDEYLMLSALQHYAFCPRQFALIHNEQAWAENRFTAEGNILHERVDSGVAEQWGEVRPERGVLLESRRIASRARWTCSKSRKAMRPAIFRSLEFSSAQQLSPIPKNQRYPPCPAPSSNRSAKAKSNSEMPWALCVTKSTSTRL